MLPVILGLGGAALSAYQENEKMKAQTKAAQTMAEGNKYSPWTGVRNEVQGYQGPGVLGAAVGGGASGAMMGMNMGSMFGGAGAGAAGDAASQQMIGGINANAQNAATPTTMNQRGPMQSPWSRMA